MQQFARRHELQEGVNQLGGNDRHSCLCTSQHIHLARGDASATHDDGVLSP